MDSLVQQFKALGDPTRLRIFHLLLQHDERCVCHLMEALGLPQSTVSRHLAVLRQAHLVHARREGQWMYYRAHRDRALALFLEDHLRDNDQVVGF
ncbi:MAG: ArsR family transcriptional regulator [Gammaproteobacteria bacterium]|nr:MAG: ArsR family transcriptional regulator [Gammaproteobacteria bacterium]